MAAPIPSQPGDNAPCPDCGEPRRTTRHYVATEAQGRRIQETASCPKCGWKTVNFTPA